MSYPNEDSINASSIYQYPYVPQDNGSEVVTEVYEYDEKGQVIKMTRTITKTYPQYQYPTTWTCDVSLKDMGPVPKEYIYSNVRSDTASA